MSVVIAGTITPSVPVNGLVTLTFTDKSTGLGTVTSRTLIIANALQQTLATINMGSSLTATYNISGDVFLYFIETIVDNTGTYIGNISYLSTAFYDYTFPPLVAALPNPCDKFGVIYNLTQAELCKNAAITYGIFGQGINSNTLITEANFLLNTPYYA